VRVSKEGDAQYRFTNESEENLILTNVAIRENEDGSVFFEPLDKLEELTA